MINGRSFDFIEPVFDRQSPIDDITGATIGLPIVRP
jgi:hypothetical protein